MQGWKSPCNAQDEGSVQIIGSVFNSSPLTPGEWARDTFMDVLQTGLLAGAARETVNPTDFVRAAAGFRFLDEATGGPRCRGSILRCRGCTLK
jgi:hypothetical protein